MKYILMNIPMSKATHEGRKTNTRRPIKGVDGYEFESMAVNLRSGDKHAVFSNDGHIKQIKPKYQVGETIWVREPVKITNIINRPRHENSEVVFKYKADDKKEKIPLFKFERLKDSDGFLPKWLRNHKGIPNGCIKEMARIFLKVTNVIVERLQDISDEDIKKEGLDDDPRIVNCEIEGSITSPKVKREEYIILWNKTASKGYQWDDNPYIFCYTFEVVKNDGSELFNLMYNIQGKKR